MGKEQKLIQRVLDIAGPAMLESGGLPTLVPSESQTSKGLGVRGSDGGGDEGGGGAYRKLGVKHWALPSPGWNLSSPCDGR